MAEVAIDISHFVKRYKKKIAVDRIDLSINKGEVFGLIGPDGAGKSTIMKAVAGILKFDEGTIRVFGMDVDSERSAEKIKSRLGFMPQGLGLNLYPELSFFNIISFFKIYLFYPARYLGGNGNNITFYSSIDLYKRFRDTGFF